MMQFILDGQWSFPNLVANNGESQRIGEVPLQCSDGRVRPTRSKYHGIEQFAAGPVPNGGLVLAGRWSDLLSPIQLRKLYYEKKISTHTIAPIAA